MAIQFQQCLRLLSFFCRHRSHELFSNYEFTSALTFCLIIGYWWRGKIANGQECSRWVRVQILPTSFIHSSPRGSIYSFFHTILGFHDFCRILFLKIGNVFSIGFFQQIQCSSMSIFSIGQNIKIYVEQKKTRAWDSQTSWEHMCDPNGYSNPSLT